MQLTRRILATGHTDTGGTHTHTRHTAVSRKCTLVEMLPGARTSRFRNSQQTEFVTLSTPAHTRTRTQHRELSVRKTRVRLLLTSAEPMSRIQRRSFRLAIQPSTQDLRCVCRRFRRFRRSALPVMLAPDASTDTVAYKLDGLACDIKQDSINS